MEHLYVSSLYLTNIHFGQPSAAFAAISTPKVGACAEVARQSDMHTAIDLEWHVCMWVCLSSGVKVAG